MAIRFHLEQVKYPHFRHCSSNDSLWCAIYASGNKETSVRTTVDGDFSGSCVFVLYEIFAGLNISDELASGILF
jgi:hypothetical protein